MSATRIVVVLSLMAAALAAPAGASAASNPKSVIVALDVKGHQLWKRVPGDRNVTVLGEYDGVLVTIGAESCGVAGGVMRGFDAKSGKPLWHRDAANPIPASRLYPAVPPSGQSIVAVLGGGGPILGIDARTGKQVWAHDGVSGTAAGPLTDAGDVIVRGDATHVVGMTRATGATRWDVPLATNGFDTPTDGHTVFVYTPTDAGSRQQRVSFTALDTQTGAQIWQTTSVVPFGSSGWPLAAGDGLFFTSGSEFMPGTTGTLVALDAATGAERWRVGDFTSYSGSGPLVTPDHVFADIGGQLTALRPGDGTAVWTGPHEQLPILDFTADASHDYYVANLRVHAVAAATGKALWTWKADAAASRGGVGITLASRGIYVDEQPPTKGCGD